MTIENWLTLIIIALMAFGIWVTLRLEANRRLQRLEDTMTDSLKQLHDKVNATDKNYQRLRGILEGANIIKYEKPEDNNA